ncbi:class I tRNA ligase family protein, partial [Mycobacterium tuberculosis]|nr:class I tRNA ligase family protein [Mycobacterium tuberculosis]
TMLKLLHPMAPMMTERVYAELPWAQKGKLLVQKYPTAFGKTIASAKDLEEVAALKAVTEGTRNFRSENKISPKVPINAF